MCGGANLRLQHGLSPEMSNVRRGTEAYCLEVRLQVARDVRQQVCPMQGGVPQPGYGPVADPAFNPMSDPAINPKSDPSARPTTYPIYNQAP